MHDTFTLCRSLSLLHAVLHSVLQSVLHSVSMSTSMDVEKRDSLCLSYFNAV